MQALCTVYFDFERALKDGEAMVEQSHQSSLVFNHKLFKAHWCSVFLSHLSEAKLVKWAHGESSPLNYLYYTKRATSGATQHFCDLLGAASEAERKLPGMGILGNFRVTRLWLGIMGIRVPVLDKLESLHHSYVQSRTSDNSLSSLMMDALQNIDERNIFLAYLLRVHGDTCNDSYQLPQHILEEQKRALRARRRIESWKPLPWDVGWCALCEKCEEWRSPVAGVPVFRNPERKGKRNSTFATVKKPIFANGICTAMLDLDTRRIHCKKRLPSLSSKRRKVKTRYAKNGITLTETQASDILDKEEGYEWDGGADRAWRTCCDYPITFVHMLGVVKRLRGSTYVLCAYCGVLTYYHARTAFPRSLPDCGMHTNIDMDTPLQDIDFSHRATNYPLLEVVQEDMDRPRSDVHPALRHLNTVVPMDIEGDCRAAASGEGSGIHRDRDRRADAEEIARYSGIRMKCVYCSCRVRIPDATLVRILEEEVPGDCKLYPAVLCRKCAAASFPYRKHQCSQFLRKDRLLSTILATNVKHPVKRTPWMRKRIPD